LRALLDQLSCGVVIYNREGEPQLISGVAHQLCDLGPIAAHARAADLAKDPEHTHCRRVALETGRSIDIPLVLPWAPRRPLVGRWVRIYGRDGDSHTALVIIDRKAQQHNQTVRERLVETVELLREAAQDSEDVAFAAKLEREADRWEATSWKTDYDDPTPVNISALCQEAIDHAHARAEVRKVKLKLALPDEEVAIAENSGKAMLATQHLIERAINATKKSSLVVRGEVGKANVRIFLRIKTPEFRLNGLNELAIAAGGEAGVKHYGDTAEAWLRLPRA
jgi:signal transduction histidine kinase